MLNVVKCIGKSRWAVCLFLLSFFEKKKRTFPQADWESAIRIYRKWRCVCVCVCENIFVDEPKTCWKSNNFQTFKSKAFKRKMEKMKWVFCFVGWILLMNFSFCHLDGNCIIIICRFLWYGQKETHENCYYYCGYGYMDPHPFE